MSLIFPDGAIVVTSPVGTERIMAARISDGKIISITYAVLRAGLQATLVSGTSIKTINGESILGSGNITITSGSIETGDTIRTKLGITTLSGSNTGDQDLSGKVDKVEGKSLIDNTEITRLASVTNQDISSKVDKDGTKVLSDVNFSTSKDTKLSNIAPGATANDTDANLKSRPNHTGVQPATTITEDSTHRFTTDSEKSNWNSKQAALPIDGSTTKFLRADLTWQTVSSGSGPASTDALLEGTNNLYFTFARVLASVLSGYTAGTTYSVLTATDTILQAFQKIQGMFAVIKSKLDGIADNATANQTDTYLLNRANHTGSQGAATITQDSNNRFVSDTEKSNWNGKQDTLISGTNIKTVNGTSIVGAGNVTISGGPANTDALSEGSTNLYFTVARVLAAVLTGLSTATSTAVVSTDTILAAFGKIQAQLNLKAPLASPTFTGTVSGITATMVGLGSVNNTADTAKPVSTAQQTALALKSNIAVTVGSSSALAFASDNIQGSVGTPLTGNITASTTGAIVGVVVHVVHNAGTAPTFDSKFKKLSGSGTYVTGAINHIYCEYMSATEILYTIQQRT